MFEEYTQSFRGKPGMIDLAARFEQVIGVSPRCFAELALLAGALYVPVEGASFIVDDPAFFLRREFFAKTSMTAEQISAFLAGTARTEEELSQLASARGPRPLADTTVFQAYRSFAGRRKNVFVSIWRHCSIKRVADCTGRLPRECARIGRNLRQAV